LKEEEPLEGTLSNRWSQQIPLGAQGDLLPTILYFTSKVVCEADFYVEKLPVSGIFTVLDRVNSIPVLPLLSQEGYLRQENANRGFFPRLAPLVLLPRLCKIQPRKF
jgi:hypothetical protein